MVSVVVGLYWRAMCSLSFASGFGDQFAAEVDGDCVQRTCEAVRRLVVVIWGLFLVSAADDEACCRGRCPCRRGL